MNILLRKFRAKYKTIPCLTTFPWKWPKNIFFSAYFSKKFNDYKGHDFKNGDVVPYK
jgi:hypothetical protein